jgi:DNA-binding transcriptional regulator YiaG
MSVLVLERTAALQPPPSAVLAARWQSEYTGARSVESFPFLQVSSCLPMFDQGTRAMSAPATGTLGCIGASGLAFWALLSVLTQQETSAPWTSATTVQCEKRLDTIRSAAQALCNRLRTISSLTNEEIAPLLGVSRRSFQSWLAGSSVSARKETRLRSTVEAIEKIAASDPSSVRARLLDRGAWSVRPYDLLVEGRFEAAVDLANGVRKALAVAKDDGAETLALQLDRDQSSLDTGEVRINRRLSRPLKR